MKNFHKLANKQKIGETKLKLPKVIHSLKQIQTLLKTSTAPNKIRKQSHSISKLN